MNYPDWRERLVKANDPAFYPIEWIDAGVASGVFHFWATDKAALIVTITQYPGGAIACRTIAAAGSKKELIEELKPRVEAWAKAAGCSHCLIEGRDGWRRAHPDYSHHQTLILKEI